MSKTAAVPAAVLLAVTGCASPTAPLTGQEPTRVGVTLHPDPTRVGHEHPTRRAHAKDRDVLESRPVHRPAATGWVIHWDRVAQCESGGHWDNHDTSGLNVWGGLQINLRTWISFHGDRYAPRPDLATKAQQILVAQHILRGQGIGAWPYCGRFA